MSDEKTHCDLYCELCGNLIDDVDDDRARAEAEANGFDVDECYIVCDDCYAATMTVHRRLHDPAVG